MAREKASTIALGAEERRESERLVRPTAQAVAMRARIVLAALEGDTNVSLADRLGVQEALDGTSRLRKGDDDGIFLDREHADCGVFGPVDRSATEVRFFHSRRS